MMRELTGAGSPFTRVLDVHLPCGMYKAHEHTGADGDWVLFIIDVREMHLCVNIISKCLIPNLFGKICVY
jgi:hypothetical protein